MYAAVLLNWVAGYVDLVGWVVFLGLYTANMTGNLVAVGRAATHGGAMQMLRSLVPIVGFFAGLVCAASWTRRRRNHWQPLALEALLLVMFGLLPGPVPLWTAAIPAFAMGLQNATLTRAGRLSVRTTHVTGTISRLAESLAQLIKPTQRERCLPDSADPGDHDEQIRRCGFLRIQELLESLQLRFPISEIRGGGQQLIRHRQVSR